MILLVCRRGLEEDDILVSRLGVCVTDYQYQSLNYLMTHHPVPCHRISYYLFVLPISITYYQLSGAVYGGNCGSSLLSS